MDAVASHRDAKIGVLEYWSVDIQRLTKVDLRLFENGRWIISSVVPVMPIFYSFPE